MSRETRVRSTGLRRRGALRLLGVGAGVGIVAGLPKELGLAAQAGRGRAGTVRFPRGAIIRTILKDVPPDALADGATLFHEHISISDPPPSWRANRGQGAGARVGRGDVPAEDAVRGGKDETIRKILVDNPRRFLRTEDLGVTHFPRLHNVRSVWEVPRGFEAFASGAEPATSS
jgi:hypothetical protein